MSDLCGVQVQYKRKSVGVKLKLNTRSSRTGGQQLLQHCELGSKKLDCVPGRLDYNSSTRTNHSLPSAHLPQSQSTVLLTKHRILAPCAMVPTLPSLFPFLFIHLALCFLVPPLAALVLEKRKRQGILIFRYIQLQ